MIARVVSGQEGVGMIWIPDRGLEVDDAIESAAGANPVIHGLADCFAVLRVVAGAMVRCQRTADDCDAMSVRAHDHLIESGDKIGSRGAVGNGVQPANIIDAFEDKQIFRSALGNYIAIEARQRDTLGLPAGAAPAHRAIAGWYRWSIWRHP
jgi:hypothetical protein